MATFECTIADSVLADSVLAQLDAVGAITADHRMVIDDAIRLTLTDAEIAIVEGHGLSVQRGDQLVPRSMRRDVGDTTPPGLLDLQTGFVTSYLDHAEINTRLATLAATFPALCTLTTLPFTTSGYDGSLASALGPASVSMLRITTTPATRSKPGFLVIGGTHAREWMNPLIALEFAEQLLRNYDPASADPSVVQINHIVDTGDVLIVPVKNPDGLNFSIHDDAGWRKNRRVNAGTPGCPGVDNNRNYEVYFGGAGSSPAPCDDNYHGPAELSEPENRNVAWVLEQFPNVLVGVDAHSSGQQILRPGPAGGSYMASLPVSAADHAIYTALETTLGSAIASVNGTVYSTGSTSNHAGTSDEYMFFAHRVFGFNTECGTSFQPPWATAAPVIAEVVTGLRAIATATVDLATTTSTPLSVVQCIDRTGSMVAFGYDGSARTNAKRFVDMLSLGDRTGVVTFADPSPDPLATPEPDRAHVDVPITLLDDPGDAGPVRSAIDAISFGGWTPIGAGLLASATLLAGAAAPTAVLLLSDGYENRTPTVASVLPTLPPGLRAFTVALGPAADVTVLQQIATQTGGTFHVSPTALDLHQAYNDMRSGITDDGLLANEVVVDGVATIDVEPSADRLTFTVSGALKKPPAVTITAPSGRAVRFDDFGISTRAGEGYRVVSVDRPPPGRWRIHIRAPRTPCVVAAFVASPLRLHVELPSNIRVGQKVAARIHATFDDRPLAPLRTLIHSRLVQHATPGAGQRIDPDRAEPRSLLERRPKLGPIHRWEGTSTDALPPGCSQVHLEHSGRLPGGAPFHRLVTRVVRAVA